MKDENNIPFNETKVKWNIPFATCNDNFPIYFTDLLQNN
jgi:hypothetical protein